MYKHNERVLAFYDSNEVVKMRLGDLDALKEKINAFYDKLFVGCVSSELITFASGVDGIIDNFPTVENDDNAIQYTKGYQDGFLEGKKICEKPHGENKPLNWLDRCDDDYLSEN